MCLYCVMRNHYSDLFHRDRLGLTCGSNINPSYITHYLKFSVTVTTNQLWSKPYSDYQFFLYNKISKLKEQGLGYRRIEFSLLVTR